MEGEGERAACPLSDWLISDIWGLSCHGHTRAEAQVIKARIGWLVEFNAPLSAAQGHLGLGTTTKLPLVG